MTVIQRDLLALWCHHMGIKSPINIKKQIEEYEQIREIVNLCCEEKEHEVDSNV